MLSRNVSIGDLFNDDPAISLCCDSVVLNMLTTLLMVLFADGFVCCEIFHFMLAGLGQLF